MKRTFILCFWSELLAGRPVYFCHSSLSKKMDAAAPWIVFLFSITFWAWSLNDSSSEWSKTDEQIN